MKYTEQKTTGDTGSTGCSETVWYSQSFPVIPVFPVVIL